ncbi:DMT family transporter [Rhodoligotrophos ferricapiens]|uniref:DMT family transporter n=1 Tax=Rhodoligotrophos ferricapiens TaxID=3069264 RepID=UPI00315D6206
MSLPVYLWMLFAIVCEVIATSALQASQQFTRVVPTIVMVVCYVAAFYALSHALKVVPVGIAYAIWSGLGIVLITLVGYLFLNQTIDLAGLIGIGFIIAGVVIVNVFSKTVGH